MTFPFLVGSVRSGTTLLRAMIRLPHRDGCPEGVLLHRLPGAPSVREALKATRPQNYAQAVRELYATDAHRSGKTRYVDKTPRHVFHIPMLSALFSEAEGLSFRELALGLGHVELRRARRRARRAPSFPEHHRRLALPPTAGLRDWRREMSAEHVKRCEQVAADTLRQVVYEVVTGPHPS